MQFGLVRRKVRTQRRHGMPIENPLMFYPWRTYDFLKGAAAWGTLALRHRRMRKRIQHDPASRNYIDESLRVTLEGCEPAGRVHGSLRRQDPGDPWGAEARKGGREGRRRIARRSERLAGIRETLFRDVGQRIHRKIDRAGDAGIRHRDDAQRDRFTHFGGLAVEPRHDPEASTVLQARSKASVRIGVMDGSKRAK